MTIFNWKRFGIFDLIRFWVAYYCLKKHLFTVIHGNEMSGLNLPVMFVSNNKQHYSILILCLTAEAILEIHVRYFILVLEIVNFQMNFAVW